MHEPILYYPKMVSPQQERLQKKKSPQKITSPQRYKTISARLKSFKEAELIHR